jgi:hypothetical protein
MTVNTAVVDPRFLSQVGVAFFPTIGSIEAPLPSQSDSGEESYTWTPVDGLESVALAFAPSAGVRYNTEIRRDNMTEVRVTQYALLQGYYPQITESMRLVIDDVAWNILAIDADSQSTITQLTVERVAS